MSRAIHTKRIIDMVLGAQSIYDNRKEHITSLNHRVSYLERQHYKVKKNRIAFTDELSSKDKELLSYIEARLKATKRLREKLIEDDTFKEYEDSKQVTLDSENDKDIPEYIERAIHKVALEISKKPNSHDYQKIVNSLKLFHSSPLNGKKVAKKMDIKPNTFSTWKTKTDKEVS